jgi:predicted DNA-binding transcriptional regulator AlpA
VFTVRRVKIEDVYLMGPTEIQLRLGISRQRAYILTGRRDFPAPRWELAMGKVWWQEDVEQWIRENRPGLDAPEEL